VKERVLIEDSIICEDVELGDDVKIIRCYISKKSNIKSNTILEDCIVLSKL